MGDSGKLNSPPDFGAKIRFLRKKKGLTQADMAQRLGLSIRGYSKVELGETQLGVIRLFEIAEILDVSVHEVLLPDLEELRYEIQEGKNIQQERIKKLHLLLEKIFSSDD